MQKERSVKYDFDFEKLYKKLKRFIKTDFLSTSGYYYLTRDDFFHDVLIKSMKHVEANFDGDVIDETTFLKICITTGKWEKLASRNTTKRNSEFANFIQISSIEPTSNNDQIASKNWGLMLENTSVLPVDVDVKMLYEVIDKEYPVIKKVLRGYTFAEGAREEGMSRWGYGNKYHKEVEKLKRTNLNYLR